MSEYPGISLEDLRAELGSRPDRIHPLDLESWKEVLEELDLAADARAHLADFIARARPDIHATWSFHFPQLWSAIAAAEEEGVDSRSLPGFEALTREEPTATPLARRFLACFQARHRDAPPHIVRRVSLVLAPDLRDALPGEARAPGSARILTREWNLVTCDLELETIEEHEPRTRSGFNAPLAWDRARRRGYFIGREGICRYDARSGEIRRLKPPLTDKGTFCWALALSPEGRELIALHLDPSMILRLDAETGEELARFPPGRSNGSGMAVSFRWRRVFVPADGPRSWLLDLDDGRIVRTLRHRDLFMRDRPYNSAISPADGSVAIGSSPGLRLWRPEDARSSRLLDPDGDCASFSPDGSRIWYRRGDNALLSMDPRSAESRLEIELPGTGHSADGGRLAYCYPPIVSSDGRYVLAELARWHRWKRARAGRRDRPEVVTCVIDLDRRIVFQAPEKRLSGAAFVAT